MYNINSGYSGFSMSNNAVNAYEDGEMPISKWTKEAILDFIENETSHSTNFLNRLTKNELKELFVRYTSWHHTSNRFNKTDFYSIDCDLLDEFIEDSEENIEKIISERKIIKKGIKRVEEKKYVTALVKFHEWVGTRKHPKKVEYTEVVKFMSNDKMVACSTGKKRMSSLRILKKVEQKTKFAAEKKVLK